MSQLGPFWLIICGVAIFMLIFTITNETLASLGLLQGALTVGWAGAALLALVETINFGKEDEKEVDTWEEKHKRIRRNNARNRYRKENRWN